MRSRSSAAAFSVNVTATTSRIGTPSSVVSATTRSTSERRLARARTCLDEQRHAARLDDRSAWRGLVGVEDAVAVEVELRLGHDALDSGAGRGRSAT